jgi:hypothetical protein
MEPTNFIRPFFRPEETEFALCSVDGSAQRVAVLSIAFIRPKG